MAQLQADLQSLRINRSNPEMNKDKRELTRRGAFVIAVVVTTVLAAGAIAYAALDRTREVTVQPVQESKAVSPLMPGVALNATGYIVAAHTIELASKVVGKVSWIGVDKGDKVRQGEELVRLEDQEYQAQVLQARGQLESLKAHLVELEHGARPQEIQRAKADLGAAQANAINARITLRRTQELARDGVVSKQALDDAQAKYDNAEQNEVSVERTYDLARSGTRQEDIDVARAQVDQAQGTYNYALQGT